MNSMPRSQAQGAHRTSVKVARFSGVGDRRLPAKIKHGADVFLSRDTAVTCGFSGCQNIDGSKIKFDIDELCFELVI